MPLNNTPEHFLKWGGSTLPPVEHLPSNIRQDYLCKLYLQKLEDDHHPQRVLRRCAEAALGANNPNLQYIGEGRFNEDSQRRIQQANALAPFYTRAKVGLPGGMRSVRHLDANTRLPPLQRTASEPSTRELHRSHLVSSTPTGRYGHVWLPEQTLEARGPYFAGARSSWGPVARCLAEQSRIR
eukprot:gnl/TRDRNA2_/TRDRNA2_186891_c0_seq1.p1 gnl/TRDRNA2_/TRDRNA2_186891_c0~~gnl/TRDRNA2_/TRDRNA2_186891_c0_seq1.p1  ORF type:complete len:183 (-),score=18.99 gnl/TRDRNA2_/TRDRNA2_186891_c0_seq1:59-607(-)